VAQKVRTLSVLFILYHILLNITKLSENLYKVSNMAVIFSVLYCTRFLY